MRDDLDDIGARRQRLLEHLTYRPLASDAEGGSSHASDRSLARPATKRRRS